MNRPVRRLTDFVAPVDIPFHELLDIPVEADRFAALDAIWVAEAWTSLDDAGFTLGADFYLGALPALGLPGLDQLALEINKDAFARGEMRLGADGVSLSVDQIELDLTFHPSILAQADGSRARLETACAFLVDTDGLTLLSVRRGHLPRSRVGGTGLWITLDGVGIGRTPDDWLHIESATIELPTFVDATSKPVTLSGDDLSLGRDGLSGTLALAGAGLNVSLFDFDCRLDEAMVTLERGNLGEVRIAGAIDISRFAPEAGDRGWVAVAFEIGATGISAQLSDPDPLVQLEIDGVFALAARSLRLEANRDDPGATVWLSGSLTPDIKGVDGTWPTLEFDEIGISSSGGIRLAAGASIATTAPFTVGWNFASLTVTAFSLERPEGSPDELILRLSAGIELVKGIPAGASVDGLVVHKSAHGTSVRFDGIGIRFGVPGAFDVAISAAWDSRTSRFSGEGHFDIPSLDLRLDAIFDVREESDASGRFTAAFVAAEAPLLPGGVPIAASGFCLYAVSGLIAVNREIGNTDPKNPRSYFDAYRAGTTGFSSIGKWDAKRDAMALGLGVVIGTADDGWSINARGALILTLPELAVLAMVTGDVLSERKPMSDAGTGKLQALLAVHPALKRIRGDFSVEWDEDPAFRVIGNGGIEAIVDHPPSLSLWAGTEDSPISADFLNVGGWLLRTRYWFGIGPDYAVALGIRSPFELGGGGSVRAEIAGEIGANAKLGWAPFQLVAKAVLNARATLAAGSLRISFTLAATPVIQVPRPRIFRVPLEACISIRLGIKEVSLCLRYTFDWSRADPPRLEAFLHGLSFVPRHWLPRPGATGNVVESGTVSHAAAAGNGFVDLGLVEPHSVLILEFSKAVTLALSSNLVHLNQAARPRPLAIGPESGYFARWTLSRLALIDHDAGGREVEIFGTFSRSPLSRNRGGKPTNPRLPNTELRLLSSNRFGQEGSLGGGGAEETPQIDCAPRSVMRRCTVSLAGLHRGAGRLPNGWPYLSPRTIDDHSDIGVGVFGDNFFRVWFPEWIGDIEISAIPYDDGILPPEPWPTVILPRSINPADPSLSFAGGFLHREIAWYEVIGDDGSGEPQASEGSSGHEEWTVDDALRVLHPRHHFSLHIEGDAQLLNAGDKPVGAPQPFSREYRFQAAGAPDWTDALSRAIAAVYPVDGMRPIFRGYDLMMRFKADFYPALYRLDGKLLGLRLRDSDGKLVAAPDGRTVHVPNAWSRGEITSSPVEDWWRKTHGSTPGNQCSALPPVPDEQDTVLAIPLAPLDLRPELRYAVELVAIDAVNHAVTSEVLGSASFTTSRYKIYDELVAPPALQPTLGLSRFRETGDADFDDLVASCGAPAIAMPHAMRMTPVADGATLTYILIEAPEPLRDREDRLTILVDGNRGDIIANLDATRLFVKLTVPQPLNARTQTVRVTLDWDPAPRQARLEDRRLVTGTPRRCTLDWTVSLAGLF